MTLEPISIATKGYVCFNGTDYCPDDIAMATKGYVCIVDVVPEILRGGDSSARAKEMLREIELQNEAAIGIVLAISRKRRH